MKQNAISVFHTARRGKISPLIASVHNTVISSTRLEGEELLPGVNSEFDLGYDEPRDYLPEELVKLLDEKFPNIS